MDRNGNDLAPELEERWREWSQLDPAIGEDQLRSHLLDRIRDRRSRPRARLALAAVAASLLAVLIGLETTRHQSPQPIMEGPAVVHETGDNVILILREDKNPIYVLTGSTADGEGERP